MKMAIYICICMEILLCKPGFNALTLYYYRVDAYQPNWKRENNKLEQQTTLFIRYKKENIDCPKCPPENGGIVQKKM